MMEGRLRRPMAMTQPGMLRSSQERPVAMSMACDAPCEAGWVMRAENLLSCAAVGGVVVVMVFCCEKKGVWTARQIGRAGAAGRSADDSVVYGVEGGLS